MLNLHFTLEKVQQDLKIIENKIIFHLIQFKITIISNKINIHLYSKILIRLLNI